MTGRKYSDAATGRMSVSLGKGSPVFLAFNGREGSAPHSAGSEKVADLLFGQLVEQPFGHERDGEGFDLLDGSAARRSAGDCRR